MNKKYCIYSALMMLLMASQPAFSMGGGKKLVFSAAKALGAGTGIGLGLAVANKSYNDRNNFNRKLDESGSVRNSLPQEAQQEFFLGSLIPEIPVPIEVEQFARKRMEELSVPNARSMKVMCIPFGSSWGAINDKALCVGMNDTMELKRALQNKLLLVERYNNCLEVRSQLEHNIIKREKKRILSDLDRLIDEQEKNTLMEFDRFLVEAKNEIDRSSRVIARETMILGHEAWHIINEDTKKLNYALGTIPVGVQVVSSAISRTFNKIFGIKDPKTWFRTILRSSAAVGSIVPKLLLAGIGRIAYDRHVEANADEFACKNAQSLEQLEEFRSFFQRIEDDVEKKVPNHKDLSEASRKWQLKLAYFIKDPNHPYPGDRVKDVQKHIDQWKKDHKEE
jgi:hypothetical protein